MTELQHKRIVKLENELAQLRRTIIPIEDIIEFFDAAHAVIDQIRMHVDHAEYEGGMNAVENFRQKSSNFQWKYNDIIYPDEEEDQ